MGTSVQRSQTRPVTAQTQPVTTVMGSQPTLPLELIQKMGKRSVCGSTAFLVQIEGVRLLDNANASLE